jgi:tetratricopeptide (TPR) repeat protein
MDGATAGEHAFATPELAIKEFAVLYWRPHNPDDLDRLALRGAADPALPLETRVSLATFVVVLHGKRGVETPIMTEAAHLAQAGADQLSTSFADNLARQACYRGLAFLPFVRRDRAGTLDVLDQAYRCQMEAIPNTALEKFAWDDYAFPLFETLAKTNTLLGRPQQAVTATDTLIAISPHDHRTWAARGRALLASGKLDEALIAYTQMESLGGLAAASATFHQGWVLQQLGRHGAAAQAYRKSVAIDPTVAVVANQLDTLDHAINQLA